MGPLERLAAWLVTGPVGHLVAGVTDLAVFFYRVSATAAFRRVAGRRRP